ncbi:MAG: hypothetical protein MJK04_22760 [Psychrosphaera sp.]|nr:hypothetical protein [Psychrosphaera sp.]
MIKLAFSIIIIVFTQAAFAEKYTGCTDPNYVAYVEKRLSFYEKLAMQKYQKTQKELLLIPFNELKNKKRFLITNTVLSARFDTSDVAISYIQAYEQQVKGSSIMQKMLEMVAQSDDYTHQINIAKGWLALKSGDEDEAVRYLMASTKTKGSPVLGSFGPDKTLIRELYKRGNKSAVLQYLTQIQLFWNTDSAINYIDVWRKMIKNDCPIQFQFYDTTSIVKLGLG